jgi:hypothetical protein
MEKLELRPRTADPQILDLESDEEMTSEANEQVEVKKRIERIKKRLTSKRKNQRSTRRKCHWMM